MSHNQLVCLPTSIQRLTKLIKLYLGANKLTELPPGIGDLRELKELYVTGNPLIVDAVRCLQKLKKKGPNVAIDISGENGDAVTF